MYLLHSSSNFGLVSASSLFSWKEERLGGWEKLFNAMPESVARGSSTSILESDLIHFLSCGAWILIPGDTAFLDSRQSRAPIPSTTCSN
eukprot:scaffold12180_cov71-Skeletonema_dohrnii-CCMP3373.AAC.1